MLEPTINLYHTDCNKFMADVPDKYYELAIVDPPYGIGMDGQKLFISKKNNKHNRKQHDRKEWDNQKPDEKYFNELFRISQHQIIWGGNYFTEYLKSVKGWIFWYKGQNGLTMSDGEMAWTSLPKVTRQIELNRIELLLEGTIHPTQKPIALYKWLLQNYAKKGDKIFDSHGGSMSIAIACYDLGFDLDLCELDADYFRDGKARFEAHRTKQRELRQFGYAKTELQKVNPTLF